MKKDIVLCGVGGDGIVSVAKIISDAALNMGMNLKQSEIHGMSQRGGSVFSHLRISSHTSASPTMRFSPMSFRKVRPTSSSHPSLWKPCVICLG